MTRLVNLRPRRRARIALALLPVLVLLIGYVLASAARHHADPNDKVLPTVGAMVEATVRLATTVDPRTGQVTLLADTLASLKRLAWGVSIATGAALVLGLALGVIPLARALFGPLITFVSEIPPIAVLPILFIALGLGETSKVALIAVGIAPYMARDLIAYLAALPVEQSIKAQTLGASSWQLLLRVALPQLLPRLLQTLRLSMGPAWVFLISAEAIAADVGLGYRIFLLRRYLAMDIILPYVLWIALLAILIDLALSALSRRLFPWAHEGAA